MIKSTKKLLTLVLALLLLSTAFSQSEQQRIVSYIERYKELAINEMMRTGVPAAITLAQGILETAGGQSDLASVANNHFGIKCKNEWTGETMTHDDDAKGECFRKYPSAEDSYKDHSDFLKNRPHYAFLFKLDPTDYEGWAYGLKKAGYATSPTYAKGIIRTIVENNLQQYTIMGLQQHELRNDLFATGGVMIKKEEIADDQDETTESKSVMMPVAKETRAKKAVKWPNSVFVINESKVIYAEAGTSLLALANTYNVTLRKLMEFNDLEDADILNEGQLVFLEKKAKKGTKDIHVVEESETLREIAQKEGVQLSTILDYNGLKKGMEPAAGERIYLKFPAPTSPKLAVGGLKKATSM